jgi:transposase
MIPAQEAAGESAMMGRQDRDQGQLFYEFSLDEMIPTDHLLRRINVFATAVLADLHEQLKAFYSDIGRPSVDPELMIRMLLVGYCYGIRHERRLCQEVALHLAYRWFCKLDLDDKVPHHSTFSVNRLGRFRESKILRHIFERVVATCMAAGLVKGEGFAVDASVMEANASRYHGKAPDELDWTDAQRQKRAVAEYLAGLEAEAQVQQGGDSCGGGSDGHRSARSQAAEGDLAFRYPPRGRLKPTSACSSDMGSIISSTLSMQSLSTLNQRPRAPMTRSSPQRRCSIEPNVALV